MSISCHRQISDEKKGEQKDNTAQLNTSARPVLHVTGETGTSWEHGSSARSCQLFCPSLPPPLSRPIHPQHGAWSMRWRGTDRPTDLLTDDNPALSGRGERADCGPHHLSRVLLPNRAINSAPYIQVPPSAQHSVGKRQPALLEMQPKARSVSRPRRIACIPITGRFSDTLSSRRFHVDIPNRKGRPR